MGQCLSESKGETENESAGKSASNYKPEKAAKVNRTIITVTPDMDERFKKNLHEKRRLFYYAETGDVHKFSDLFDNGKNHSPGDRMNGCTLLHCAIDADQTDIVLEMIKRDANLEQPCAVLLYRETRNTPICRAAFKGYCDTVKVIFDAGANPAGAMLAACLSGHPIVSNYLLEKGCDIDEDLGRPGYLWPLLQTIYPPNKLARTFEMSTFLIEKGANINLVKESCESESGLTALHLVLRKYFKKTQEKQKLGDTTPPKRLLRVYAELVSTGADIDIRFCENHGGQSSRDLMEKDPYLEQYGRAGLETFAKRKRMLKEFLLEQTTSLKLVVQSEDDDDKESLSIVLDTIIGFVPSITRLMVGQISPTQVMST
eukprot:993354_1